MVAVRYSSSFIDALYTSTTPNQKSNTTTTTTTPSPSETTTIITVINGFLTALRTKSASAFEKYCIRAGGMSLWPPSSTLPRFCTIGTFVEQITRVQADLDECIWDAEVKVYEPGNLAAVWAPFRANIDGVVHHVGVELFILHKMEGTWKVTGLADSCRLPTEEESVLLL
ncbi:hypothetical protein BO70DRAFT_390004 [Aspergillus heteromorphus CBS 117.55]|uniref:SnoaL-like domain-containing protein n=1 Tax=Aspergillus heteromorphus CBS 117.55 TaxID=1448321 RepID=A0A317V5Y5_9EURO|nr:uncharacterized protein BO70DRAFT_390004 [Aspergillus heteromorphus CBS 117.55]PWY69734.1 hypothetical protein BO70DRAFT_390004 [Aspergillus heteromorphus CBS 117.55]